MTNTRITDPEIMERRYPVVLHQFKLRTGSGGEGRWRGGDGVVREIEFLRPLTAGILSERRVLRPFGLLGGMPGRSGQNLMIRKAGRVVNLGGRATVQLNAGDRMVILTPGAGGYGSPDAKEEGVGSIPSKRARTDSAPQMQGSVAEFQARQEQA